MAPGAGHGRTASRTCRTAHAAPRQASTRCAAVDGACLSGCARPRQPTDRGGRNLPCAAAVPPVGAPRGPARVAALLARAALRVARASAARVDLGARARVRQRLRVVAMGKPLQTTFASVASHAHPGKYALQTMPGAGKHCPLRAASAGGGEAADLTRRATRGGRARPAAAARATAAAHCCRCCRRRCFPVVPLELPAPLEVAPEVAAGMRGRRCTALSKGTNFRSPRRKTRRRRSRRHRRRRSRACSPSRCRRRRRRRGARGVRDQAISCVELTARIEARHVTRWAALVGDAAARTMPARRSDQTLNRKCITSPSLTTYSLPSIRSFPASRARASPPSFT